MHRSIIVTFALMFFVIACGGKPQGDTNPPLDKTGNAALDAQTASLVRGGLLYDKWWKTLGAKAPEGDQALWATQVSNTRSGTTTWRCKECHAWDYKGLDGAYGIGSHFTGFTGLLGATEKPDAALKSALTTAPHDFSAVGDEGIDDLVLFLKKGVIDVSPFIDENSKAIINGDATRGEVLFKSTCVACHGTEGVQMNFGDEQVPTHVGGLSRGNPWEFFHKVRFGQPGTKMPAGLILGWSLEDIRDLTAYCQTLPE